MNAIQALNSAKIAEFQSAGAIQLGGKNKFLTRGMGARLYRDESANKVFGMIAIDLPELITSRTESRATVFFTPDQQQTIIQAVEMNERFAYAKPAFDFTLHGTFEVGTHGLNLKSGKVTIRPTFEVKIVERGGDPQRLTGRYISLELVSTPFLEIYLFGSNRPKVKAQFNDPLSIGSTNYASKNELFRAIARSSEYMGIGKNPKMEVVDARLSHLRSFFPEAVSDDEMLDILSYYESLKPGQAKPKQQYEGW